MTTDTIKQCRNSVCKREIFDGDESTEDPAFCKGCGDLMPAFCPQPNWNMRHLPLPERTAHEEWHEIPRDNLYPGVPTSGPQCGDCGSESWVVRAHGFDGYLVKCEDDGETLEEWEEPCGNEYDVEWIPGRFVVWL
jgi:hypothetical protein